MQPLIGINEEGKVKVYINPHGYLNEIGPRCERGIPFPVDTKEVSPENAMEQLFALQQYFDAYAKGTLRGRSDIKTKPKGRKTIGLQSVRGRKFGDV